MTEEYTDNIKEPTSGQCTGHARVYEDEYTEGFAIWYPQMGGYVGRAIALFSKNRDRAGDCFDVLIWHDGEFPFAGEGEDGKEPVRLHHCDAEQFIEFGEALMRLCKEGRG